MVVSLTHSFITIFFYCTLGFYGEADNHGINNIYKKSVLHHLEGFTLEWLESRDFPGYVSNVIFECLDFGVQ